VITVSGTLLTFSRLRVPCGAFDIDGIASSLPNWAGYHPVRVHLECADSSEKNSALSVSNCTDIGDPVASIGCAPRINEERGVEKPIVLCQAEMPDPDSSVSHVEQAVLLWLYGNTGAKIALD